MVAMVWTSASLVVAPTPARAGAPAQPPSTALPAVDEPAEDPALARARELYEQGEARFATADYFAAIELWTQAFTMVPDTADSARIQAELIYDIATAREKAFEVSGDITHLRQAKLLMEDYVETIPQLYADEAEAEAERARITTRLNGIVARIDQVGRQRERDRTASQRETGPQRDDAQTRRSRAMIASGAALLVVGAGGLSMMTAGLVVGRRANDISDLEASAIDDRREQFRRGRTGNSLAIAGGVVGGVFALGGAVLVGLGASQRRRNLAVAPHSLGLWSWGRGRFGVALRGRF
jgi:hypothetical protein